MGPHGASVTGATVPQRFLCGRTGIRRHLTSGAALVEPRTDSENK